MGERVIGLRFQTSDDGAERVGRTGGSFVLTLPPSTKVFVSTKPTDMRRSFDGLVGQVRDFLGEDPLSGHLFVFHNKGIRAVVW